MAMKRTQIYIEEKQAQRLKALAARTGESQSELIRQAINGLLDQDLSEDWREQIMSAAGLWRTRDDLPSFEALRQELDRVAE